MQYDFTSRKKLYEKYYEENKPTDILESKESMELFIAISSPECQYDGDRFDCYIDRMQKSGLPPDQYLKSKYYKLVEFCVTKQHLEEFYGMIQKYNQFPYSRGMGRRTVRTKGYYLFMENIFLLLAGYYRLQFYGVSLDAYLRDELSEELLDFKRNMDYYRPVSQLDDIIAAAIDKSDARVCTALEDIILGENNTAAISVPMIRGMIKSSDRKMHELLGRFLLAARLQEGVRQAVCENMDCGTIQAFQSLFLVIFQNNLIRYSSVKRAVGTWIGIMDYDNTDRIMRKVLDTMNACLFSEEETRRCLNSQDAIEIMVGLWQTGSVEVLDCVTIMRDYLEHGSRQQKLVMSYYNRELSYDLLSGEIACKAIESHPGDLEILAAFFPTYLQDSVTVASKAVEKSSERVTWEKYFQSAAQAEKHFTILKEAAELLPTKKKTFEPLLFPWYGVELSRSDLTEALCLIAYLLDDAEKIDYVVQKLSDLESFCRHTYISLFLKNPVTKIQRTCLIQAIAEKGEYTRKLASDLLNELTLQEEEYNMLLGMLRFKKHDIRQNILALLIKREDDGLMQSAKTLLSDTREEMRLAGLDLVLQISGVEKRKELYLSLSKLAQSVSKPTEREIIMLEQIRTGKKSDSEEGYGLYDETDSVQATSIPYRTEDYPVFSVSGQQLNCLFEKLDAFIHEHRMQKVNNYEGVECILGNCKEGLPRLERYSSGAYNHTNIAFLPLWEEFYTSWIKDFPTLYAMYAAIMPYFSCENFEGGEIWENYNKELFGTGVMDMDISGYRYGSKWNKSVTELFGNILSALVSIYWQEEYCREISKKIISFLVHRVEKSDRWLPQVKRKSVIVYGNPGEFYVSQLIVRLLTIEFRGNFRNDKEWAERFQYLLNVDLAYEFESLTDKSNVFSYYDNQETWLSVYDFFLAYYKGILTERQMYKSLLEDIDPRNTLNRIKDLHQGKKYPYTRQMLEKYHLLAEENNFDPVFHDLVLKTSDKITDVFLDIELKRGDMQTKVSPYIPYLFTVTGIKRFKQILTAIGKDKLVRVNYTDALSKAGSLSCLLRISRPAKDDTKEKLASAFKNSSITTQRLIESGMFAPDWLDLLEEVLDMPGLKSGTYYFMAHMDDQFDEVRGAMIAKYTPLSKEELRDGAFDTNWFKRVWEELGEERIALLYDAAKYISYGNKHTRARKYADAAMGKYSVEEMIKEISEKRNKDQLMALGLIPITGKEDMAQRYEFISKFRKESKQYGSMRRANEERAADMALKNMALAAGYSDVTRLALAMETELVHSMHDSFAWQDIEKDYQIKLEWGEEGKCTLLIRKDDKISKTLPAALKKQSSVLSLKEVQKKVKEQYKRTLIMMERAMENREQYSLLEVKNLLFNPVCKNMVENLVFVWEHSKEIKCGFIRQQGFVDSASHIISDQEDLVLRVAHPYDLYQSGEWTKYQKIFFHKKTKEKCSQPFRQVFRELYVKLDEEKKEMRSRMFAGNQIQPSRAAACLKSRGWQADYEEGLQKIFYKDNIIARIYALADWFSPSDIEAPTLEWVEFSDRHSYQPIPIGEVPAILYSEVMRDVDLLVSVAHAGSVDPETSHSTIEMRQVIVRCNLELFALSNVNVEGSHAIIHGKKGEYNIHLGSGIIHKMGGHQINVLTVHSQNRGRIFLPFLDEDPKTAEIVSKIILFAQDTLIKDPYILQQL